MNKFFALVVALTACHAQSPSIATPAASEKPKVALVVLDGFGLGKEQPGNAIATAMAASPQGFFTQILKERVQPIIELGASGACVGLSPGMVGNSEAGHSNMCAQDVLEQRRTYIDGLVAKDALADVPAINDALTRTRQAKKPLHVFAFLSAYSSTGYYGHVMDVLRAAKKLGQSDVQLHLLCDGSGERACRDMLGEIAQLMQDLGVGTVATLAGRDHCFGKGDPTERQRSCISAMRAERVGKEPRWQDVAPRDIALDESLPPTALVGSKALHDDDTMLVLLYRRDDPQALIRTLRDREKQGDAVSTRGPTLLTFAALDDASRYADDAKLREAFVLPKREGFLNERIMAAGLTQARLAEHKKMAHVTYFCDGGETTEAASYHRFHPKSQSSEEARKAPCLRTQEVVDAAKHETDLGVDFLMMNLPNADLLGHTADFDATVAAVTCLEKHLGAFVGHARARGYTVFVTGDHGNAEEMLRDGVWHGNHSQNPVPFVAMAPLGAPAWQLVQEKTEPCLFRVSWTVLDALGLSPHHEHSLLRRDASR